MIYDKWELSDKARDSAQPYIDHLERMCPDFLSMQTRRLVALAKVHLPPMTRGEASFLARCLCAFGLPDADAVETDEIPRMIADHIRETFVVEFGAEGLAEEMKNFGHDREWRAKFYAMPENVFARWLENNLDPLQAYLLIVMVECYWIREYSTKDAVLSDFLNLEERTEDPFRDYTPPE
jgi:hypothetical protein